MSTPLTPPAASDVSRTRSGTRNLRFLIADDHDLIRRGLKSLLESHPGWSVCAEGCTGREAVAKAEELKPDIVVLDITMPELNGVEAAKKILKVSPNTEILVLSVHYSDQLFREIIDARVHGYILKSDTDHDLVTAVETLANHKPFFTARAKELIFSNSPVIAKHLTSREREIVQLVSEGKSSKEMASILGISTKTTETHRANIMRKLDVHSVSELVRYAVRNQIIEP